jgi:uncharacterized protein YjbI with pentapeptide repeats
MPLPLDGEGRCLFHSQDVAWKREQDFIGQFFKLIEIIGAQAASQYVFREFYFSENLALEELEFATEASFAYSSFAKGARFVGCHFGNGLNLTGACFEGPLRISYGTINSLMFNDGVCHKSCQINEVKKPQFFTLMNSRFLGGFSLKNVQFTNFSHQAHFSNAVFETSRPDHEVWFENVHFQGAYFDKVVFNAPLKFKGVTFDSETEFIETEFPPLSNFSDRAALPTSFTEITVGANGELTFRGSNTEKLFKRITGLFFEAVEGKVIFEHANFNYLTQKTKEEIEVWRKSKGNAQIEIGTGCIKYRHRTPERIIKLDENYQEIVTELTSTFTKYFKLSNGLNLGVEIVDQNIEQIILFYFSDENITKKEFDYRLETAEVELWNLAYNTEETINQPVFAGKLVQLNDIMLDLKSILFKMSVRVSVLGLTQADLTRALEATAFGVTPAIDVAGMHQSLASSFNPNIVIGMGSGAIKQVINQKQVVHGDINNTAKDKGVIVSGIAKNINIEQDKESNNEAT